MSENKLDKIFKNPDVLKWVIIGLAGFVFIVLIFSAGMMVGAMRIEHSYRWAENYHENFGGPKGGFLGDWRNFPKGDLINGYGVFGEIVKLNDNGFIIKGKNDIEEFVVTTADTIIKRGPETVTGGLKVSDRVTIIGIPNAQGQIEAKIIRIFNGENARPMPYRQPAPRFF